MLLFVFVIIFIIALIAYNLDIPYDFESLEVFLIIFSAIGTIWLIFFAITSNLNTQVDYAKKVEQYNKIMYKIENEICQDEILDEIEEWNSEINLSKNLQRDFWVGIFYPNMYDEFEPIDYSLYQPNGKE